MRPWPDRRRKRGRGAARQFPPPRGLAEVRVAASWPRRPQARAGPRPGEFHGTIAFGKTIWLECHLAPFVSNGQPHLLLMAPRHHRRKQAEEALKMQSLVLQNMAEGALLLGPDQTILFANAALETAFGYGPGELIGQAVAVLNAWSRRRRPLQPEAASRHDGMRALDRGIPEPAERRHASSPPKRASACSIWAARSIMSACSRTSPNANAWSGKSSRSATASRPASARTSTTGFASTW